MVARRLFLKCPKKPPLRRHPVPRRAVLPVRHLAMGKRPLLKRRKNKGHTELYHHRLLHAAKDELGKPDLPPVQRPYFKTAKLLKTAVVGKPKPKLVPPPPLFHLRRRRARPHQQRQPAKVRLQPLLRPLVPRHLNKHRAKKPSRLNPRHNEE